jgi:tetratricopeptide (TPR) repeat protein
MPSLSDKTNSQFQRHGKSFLVQKAVLIAILLPVVNVSINAVAENETIDKTISKRLRASAAYEQLRDDNLEKKTTSNYVARDLLQSGDYETAVKQYQQLLSSGHLQAEVLARILSLHLSDSDGGRLPEDIEIVDRTAGSVHFQLANRLILHGFRLAALNEYCLSVSSVKPEPGAYREIGTLMSETGHYLVAVNALDRYLALAPDALDQITIWAKTKYIEFRHSQEIETQLADAEAAQPRDLDLALKAVDSTE